MDTEKAKNITIICLLLLNAALLVCNLLFANFSGYRVTAEAEANIIEVLARNNIVFANGAELSRDFSPKAALDMQKSDYDTELLRNALFIYPDTAEFSEDGDRSIYRNETESLSVNSSTGFVVYRNRAAGFDIPEYNAAEQTANALASRLSDIYGEFKPDTQAYESDEGLVFEYRQQYRGYTINSNYLIVIVSSEGINRVEFMYAKPLHFQKERREIIPPDEALITCMYETANLYGGTDIVIDVIDLVYNMTEVNESAVQLAEPYYRIRLSFLPEPILINAYTNNTVSLRF